MSKSTAVSVARRVGPQCILKGVVQEIFYGNLDSNLNSLLFSLLLLRSYVRESGKADREGDKMAASMEKKIAELEMGLLHLQQNIDIPEITLIVHPEVAKIIKKAAESNIKPTVKKIPSLYMLAFHFKHYSEMRLM